MMLMIAGPPAEQTPSVGSISLALPVELTTITGLAMAFATSVCVTTKMSARNDVRRNVRRCRPKRLLEVEREESARCNPSVSRRRPAALIDLPITKICRRMER